MKEATQARSPMLFVTPSHDFSQGLKEENYTLVLSPHYYWCQKSERSFKNLAQAKKFAPSIFDLGENFEYDVYEYEGDFFFIAFNKQEIETQLLALGIDLSKVTQVYLAQAFFNDFKKAIAVNEKEALVRLSGVVAIVKKELCEELDSQSELATFEALKKPSFKMSGLGGSSQLQQLQKPLIVLATAAALWLVTIFINLYKTENELIAKQEAIKSQYKLPATSFQLKSMVKTLEKVDKQQHFMREVLHNVNVNRNLFSNSVREMHLNPKEIVVMFTKSIDQKNKAQLHQNMKKEAKSIIFTKESGHYFLRLKR